MASTSSRSRTGASPISAELICSSGASRSIPSVVTTPICPGDRPPPRPGGWRCHSPAAPARQRHRAVIDRANIDSEVERPGSEGQLVRRLGEAALVTSGASSPAHLHADDAQGIEPTCTVVAMYSARPATAGLARAPPPSRRAGPRRPLRPRGRSASPSGGLVDQPVEVRPEGRHDDRPPRPPPPPAGPPEPVRPSRPKANRRPIPAAASATSWPDDRPWSVPRARRPPGTWLAARRRGPGGGHRGARAPITWTTVPRPAPRARARLCGANPVGKVPDTTIATTAAPAEAQRDPQECPADGLGAARAAGPCRWPAERGPRRPSGGPAAQHLGEDHGRREGHDGREDADGLGLGRHRHLNLLGHHGRRLD